MKRVSLDGEYKLYVYERGKAPDNPAELGGKFFCASVPGNVELDLMRAGVLPDLYREANISFAEKTEKREFWYVKDFTISKDIDADKTYLDFEGVDTIAEYFLNGKKIGESDNMFIAHRFAVGQALSSGKNTLAVHIFSATEAAKRYEIHPYNVAFPGNYESLHIRKAAHCYGWDILPRAISAGIWRSVYLETESDAEIKDLYIATARADQNIAVLAVSLNAVIPQNVAAPCRLVVEGKCGSSVFAAEYPFSFPCCTVYPYVTNPKLWFPHGSGEQNLYDVAVKVVCEDRILAQKTLRVGIRKIDLVYTEQIGSRGDFRIAVNGKTVRCKGVDWTPLDVFHSHDAQKYDEAVQSLAEMNCNIVRVWGGGVYEDERFFDLCDEKGIMVWQDIMLACHAYPRTEEFAAKIGAECAAVAKKLRNHASLALYCGSNETDWAYVCVGLNPQDDTITRRVIKNTLYEFDPYRCYLPSTPYFSGEFVKQCGGRFYLDLKEIEDARAELVEEHYWWHRNDFLAFAKQNHKFIAEIGFGGSPSISSFGKFLPADCDFDNDEKWKYHSFPTENSRETGQKYLFENIPDTERDKVAASQLYQAEAYKFVVERSRIKKDCNGIILWNFRDGFPIFSSSLVDYFGEKKPAYFAVKTSYISAQCFMRASKTECEVFVVNDTGKACKGVVEIFDEAGRIEAKFDVAFQHEGVAQCGKFALNGEKALFSKLRIDGDIVENYLYIYTNKINYPDYIEIYRNKIQKIVRGD